jgi:hypothetical protein
MLAARLPGILAPLEHAETSGFRSQTQEAEICPKDRQSSNSRPEYIDKNAAIVYGVNRHFRAS